jgi:hypothetical protein
MSTSHPIIPDFFGVNLRWRIRKKALLVWALLALLLMLGAARLEGQDDDYLAIVNTMTQKAANQKIQNPAMPGMNVDLNKMTGTATGGSTFDLAHIMPVSGTIDDTTEIVMSINRGQQPQTMDMKMHVNVTLEAK